MLKFSKNVLSWLGVFALVAFAGVLIYDVIMINQLHAVAGSNRSTDYQNPRNWVLIAAGLGLLAGFLLGAALALPSKSFRARLAEMRAQEATDEGVGTGRGHGELRDSHLAEAPLELDRPTPSTADDDRSRPGE